MDTKLLVLDIDGTLTNSKKEITPATKQAILDLMNRGHKCMLASGRPTPGMRKVAEELEFDKYGGYLLSYNGAKIIKCDTKEIIYQQILPKQFIPGVYDFAVNFRCGLITYDDEKIISGNRLDRIVALESRINNLPIKEVDNFPEYLDFDVNKCLMTAPQHLAPYYEDMLKDYYGEHISIYRSEPFFIEIMPKGVDKAASLEKMLPILGISRENCIACGDGFNDITMIQFAGIGVAMANAQQKVKDVADVITLSNDEDGLVPIIEKYFK